MPRIPDSIASNSTTLSLAVETTPGVIPSDAGTRWLVQEPNEYDDFGAELELVARNPINADRQRKKGTIVGLTASGGWNTDLTASNLITLMEGFLFANARRKSALDVASFTADTINVAGGGAAYTAGTLLAVSGSVGNSGLHVSEGATANAITATGIKAGAANGATVSRVGIEFGADAAAIDASGPLPALVVAGVDFAGLGLIPGEIAYLGGDDIAETFAQSANRGFVRVFSAENGRLTFDKTDAPFVTDDGDGKSIRLFFGTVVKNEPAALQAFRTYSLRRTLSRPDLDSAVVQSEVVMKAVPNELSLNFSTEDKITADLSFMAGDYKTFSDDSVILGTMVQPREDDAFNTAGDISRISMMIYPKNGVGSSPTPVFAAFEEITLTINNNVSDNKALGHMGSYALTPGMLEVGGDVTAYFASVAAIQAVRDNDDCTFMLATVKQNKGVAIDLPMIALGTSGAEVSQDDPIMLPLDTQAATGKKYNAAMDHTVLVVFYDYLPNAASA